MSASRPRWSSQTKLTVSVLLLVLSIYLVFRFRIVITPVVLAVVLAYVLTPASNLIQARLRLTRALATLVVYLLLLLMLALIPLVVIPPLARQLSGLNVDIQRILHEVETFMSYQLIIGGQLVIDIPSFVDQLSVALQAAVEPVFGRTLGFAVEVISSLVWIVFILVVSFYLIKDGPALRAWVQGLVPAGYLEDFERLTGQINDVWAAFFRGQLLLASVVTLIFTIIGFVLGLPFALAMGVLAGLLEFLPSIGHGIWLLTASILALSAGSIWIPVPNWVFALVIIGLHLVFQQFDLNYLIPRIIGRRVQLPPLVVILGIFAGAALAGVLGIVLAAPTIASARILSRYVFANLFDQDPFLEEPVRSLPPPDPAWWRLKVGARGKPAAYKETDQVT